MKTCLRAVTHRQRKIHTVEQIIKILRQVDEGCAIDSACREHNISKATFHRWRRKYGRMEMKDAKRLKELEKENTELKKIVERLSTFALTMARNLSPSSPGNT